MAIKDDSWLENFLNSQEKELRDKCRFLLSVQAKEVWARAASIESTRETLPVARTYTIEVSAAGFKRGPRTDNPVKVSSHKFDLHVLRTFPDYKENTGAPVRVTWRSAIFHPNIMNGTDAGGRGYVCWARTDSTMGSKGWQRDERLLTMVEGLRELIERPGLNNPITKDSDCKAATAWYKTHYPDGFSLQTEVRAQKDVILRRGRDGS